MTLDDVITALDLPTSSRVDRRVPKKLLLENGAPTPADKRRINDGIEDIVWLAALKPTTIGVPEYRDAVREYLEIAVVRVSFRAKAKAARSLELIHRAVPYPLLLLVQQAGQVGVSAVHKRWAQNEAGKTVLDGDVTVANWEAGADLAHGTEFRCALALGQQPHDTLFALYQGWINVLLAFKAARLTGAFRLATDTERASARQEALRECARLETEMARLRAAAAKERQMARRIELNLQLKRIEAAHASARARL